MAHETLTLIITVDQELLENGDAEAVSNLAAKAAADQARYSVRDRMAKIAAEKED
jgi:hypothetical protein